MVAWALNEWGLFLFRTNIFMNIVIEGFNNLLNHCSSLKGYVRSMQQDEVVKCLSHSWHSPMEDA
jgi:hypothetical protein